MQQHEGIPQTVLRKINHTKEDTLYDFIYRKFKIDKTEQWCEKSG